MPSGTHHRTRRDVQSLMQGGATGKKVLDDYAKAIQAMRQRDSANGNDMSDPRSWRFQAAIHGFDAVPPTVHDPHHFSSCRHGSWFFLAWHRVYLYFFERMIQHHSGNPDWALPYWDYTKPNDPDSRLIPEPFRTPTQGNSLYTEHRDPRYNGPNPHRLPFDHRCDAMPALGHRDFAVDDADDGSGSFGGGKVHDSTPNHVPNGALEDTPHGWIHMLVGGDTGWMANFNRAARDPIFWLHHCNLDRLWQVWIEHYGSDRLPTGHAWLDTQFELFDKDGSRRSKTIKEILMTQDLGYVYESTAPPAPIGPQPRITARAAAPEPPPGGRRAEPLGAVSDVPFASRAHVRLDLEPHPQVEEPERWFLRLEDVTGERPVTGYDVYLNLPEDASPEVHEERLVGGLASFGLAERSRADDEHGGLGVTRVFDITAVVKNLQDEGAWDPTTARVTIVPVDGERELEDGGDVHAGRISIYAA